MLLGRLTIMRALLKVALACSFSVAAMAQDAPPKEEPPKKEEPPPKKDDRATKDDYVLDTSASTGTIKLGSDGAFSLKITPKNGKKVHPDAPLEVALKESPLLKPAKTKLGRGDAVDKAAHDPEVTTTLKAQKAGNAVLEVSLSFFLCTDAWCQRMSDRAEIPITVEE